MMDKHLLEKILVFFFALVAVFSLSSLSVTAAFDNCPGDTINGWWDISNTQTVNTTQNITCEYINISSGGRLYINSSIGNVTVNITVGNLTIQAGGEINGTGTGSLNGTGEGSATISATNPGGGGGHGGRGSLPSSGPSLSGNPFGNPLEPRTLGGAGVSPSAGGPGGASVLINVSNITWVNGTIAINGEPMKTSGNGAGGGGAGGSLFLDTDQLYGTGLLQAKGGQGRDAVSDGGSGGGGRIAVYYKTVGQGFNFNNTNVQGGPAITANVVKGEPGTAVFIQKDNKELYIVGGFDFTLATYNYSNVTFEHALLRANRSFEFNATSIVNTGGRNTNITCHNTTHDWTLRSLQVLGLDNVNITDMGREYMECGNITIHRLETRTNYTTNNLIILSNKTIVFNVTNDDLVLKTTILLGNLNITNLTNLSLDSTSFINATGRGNPNGTFEGKGKNANGAGGGGYGGIGGKGENNDAGGAQYGDPFAPSLFGAPGGAALGGGFRGSNGGGIIYLNISGTFWNNGTIVADGENRGASQGSNEAGVGSGGSIWIDTTNYYGTGSLSARGGRSASATGAGGSGGGGRIAVYYNATNTEVFFNRTNVDSQDSADITVGSGDAGTAIFIDKDDKNLYIVGGFEFTLATYNYSNVTVEHAFLRVNRSFELNATGISNIGNRITNMSCYNTSHDFTIRTLRDIAINNFNLSDSGADYNECGNITIHRLETRTNVTVNRLTVESNKTLIFNVTSDDLVLNATILIGNLNITNLTNLSLDSTSFINATGRGNPNGTFEGKGKNANGAGGGGYGGIGGKGENNDAGGAQYGDPFAPSLFGAPGGAALGGGFRGSNGGGIIYLNISGTLWNNGTIVADGENRGASQGSNEAGVGSGGSIWIDTTNYYGTGSLSARGGRSASATGAGGSGGGGRIAVYYNATNTEVFFNRTNVDSQDSADTTVGSGDAGTAIFIDKDDKNLYIVGGFEFTLATYNYSNVTIEDAFLRVNRSFELNATMLLMSVGDNRSRTNMTCYNTSHDYTLRSLRVLSLDNLNVSDVGADYSDCGNITIHRLETRTNYTINRLTLVSNKTIVLNVTSDDLILNATRLFGNFNITNLTNLSIYSTSIINASGYGEQNGTGEGRGGSSGVDNEFGGGGTYGGRGGHGLLNSAIQGRAGNPYGDPFAPKHFGSPGGAGGVGGITTTGTAGGGIIYLNISGTVWNNGTLIADGQDNKDASADRGGAGSGGSIWIDTTNYFGTGTLSAKGGRTPDAADESGAGGGGRIALYYNTTNNEVQFNTTRTNDGYPASSFNIVARPEPATAIFMDKDDKNLYILGGFDFTLPTYNFSNVTVEHAFLKVNNTFELNATTFVNIGNRITNMTCYNTSHDITIKTLQGSGLDNFNISDYGRNYNECGNITIYRTETRTNYSISFATIESNGTLVFNVTNDDLTLTKTLFFGNMNFTVANFTLNGTSSLIANFRGYGNATGLGAGGTNASGNRGGGGAGYGGAGGSGEAAGGLGGSTYGSNVTPNELGSGGGGSGTGAKGGVGGGFIFINASNRLELNGTINASGASGLVVVNVGAGGGSGGSIWIWTRILNGTGTLSVHGADGGVSNTDGGGGGGGRIAVYFRNDQTNGYTKDVRGGEGSGTQDGAAGTIEFLQTNDTTNPSITMLRPVVNAGAAVNSRVNISMNVTDNDEVFNVSVNITYPDNSTKILLTLENFTRIGTIYNHSFSDTSQFGTYNLTFFANDTTGNRNETEKTNFTVDNIAPTVATLRPAANNFTAKNSVVNISATVTDNNAVDIVLANVTYPDNTTKEQLRLVNSSGASPSIFNFSFGNTSTEGNYNVTFIANDTFNNINNTEKTNFTVDSTAPSVTVLRPTANTVFDNASIVNISATVTDLFLNVDAVLANLTFPDNTSKEQFTLQRVGSVYNFSINITNQSGVYNVTFIANDTGGNLNTTEKTNFTMNASIISSSIDIANSTNITFTPDPMRQNDRVSFNTTFNVTGNLNATGLNVTLTVDNIFVTSTSFNLANGSTRVVEMNWTAENGTHAIRINADANNTFATETFENNNNATATVTVFNVSVLNFSSPGNNAEIIRGLDTSSLPGEDTMKRVTNLTTIQARVHNRYATGSGVNSNCTFYFNNTIFLGWNQTNTTGECTFTFDRTIYATAVYNITVNYTNLNTTNYLTDINSSLIQNRSLVDLGKVEVDLDADNQRTGSVYNPGDVAVMNITVTKNGTAFDPNQFTVEVKNPGTECTSTGGILFNHSYPGDVVRVSAGLFQSYSVLEVDTDVHWCVVVNNSNALALGSATHSDKEVTNTNANRANLTIINSASQGDDAVFDDVNITFFSSRGNYKIFDRNFSAADSSGENRVLTLNERYDVLFRHPARQEQLNITGLNISTGNKSLPFNLLINYSGALPVRFTNLTDIIAFNSSGFAFTSANITLQKNNVNATKIVHCTNWNFSAGACIGIWEINQTSDYANFAENATHMWFQVTGFTAYAGGNGSNTNLTIYDQADVQGGSIAAQTGNNINFTANYTRAADNVTITGASCNISFSTAPLGPSAMTYESTKQIYNFTRTFNATGNFTWNATCGAASFDTLSAVDTIEVSDTTAPLVSVISPTSITSAQQYTFSATVTDGSSPLTCNLFINNANDGAMTVSGTTASRVASYNVSSQQIIPFYANCTDPSGNNGFNITNVTVAPQELGGGNPGGGSRAGGESSAATADGLEGGTAYLNLAQGDIITINEYDVNSYVKVLVVYPNSVRLDIGGNNVILLESLFRRYDLNNNGILETTVYVDDVVSYSKAAISILVEEDGGTTAQSSQFFDVLGSIWQRVVAEQETDVEAAEEGTDQTQEQAEEIVVAQEEKPKESYTKRILNFMVEFGEYVKSKGGMTGGVVAEQGENLQEIISSPAQRAILVSILTLGVLIPAITGSYVYRKKYTKRKNKIAQEIEEEMKYKGL